jgi:hypothetical protein
MKIEIYIWISCHVIEWFIPRQTLSFVRPIARTSRLFPIIPLSTNVFSISWCVSNLNNISNLEAKSFSDFRSAGWPLRHHDQHQFFILNLMIDSRRDIISGPCSDTIRSVIRVKQGDGPSISSTTTRRDTIDNHQSLFACDGIIWIWSRIEKFHIRTNIRADDFQSLGTCLR